MDLNRNQFFFIGLVVLLLGLQVRYVSAYVLNPEATKFLAERTGQSSAATSPCLSAFGNACRAPRKVAAAARMALVVLDLGRRRSLFAFAGDAEARLRKARWRACLGRTTSASGRRAG